MLAVEVDLDFCGIATTPAAMPAGTPRMVHVINHNVIEMPLWALAGFAFHAGLRQGKLRHWILLGVALGLAWWAKYRRGHRLTSKAAGAAERRSVSSSQPWPGPVRRRAVPSSAVSVTVFGAISN